MNQQPNPQNEARTQARQYRLEPKPKNPAYDDLNVDPGVEWLIIDKVAREVSATRPTIFPIQRGVIKGMELLEVPFDRTGYTHYQHYDNYWYLLDSEGGYAWLSSLPFRVVQEFTQGDKRYLVIHFPDVK